ncbi:MAG: response regulator transcription factor [Acidimicrobiales bacterium]
MVDQPGPLRLVVADDVLITREGIVRMLEGEQDIDVVAVGSDLPELLSAVDEHTPDVVLTDIRMPPGLSDEGIQAATALRQSHPDVGVVVLSQYVDAAWALALFAEGSERRAYLLKERVSDPAQLTAAIHEVAGGGSVVDPKVVEALMGIRTRRRSALDDLSRRELEVLAEIAQGKSNAAVAQSLYLSVRAVEKHINSLFAKLGLGAETAVHRRVKAALLYLAESASGGDGSTP